MKCMVSFCVCFLATVVFADLGRLPGAMVSGSPILDGKPDDIFWSKAKAISGFVTANNQPAEQNTTVKVAYNQDGIYVLFLCDSAAPDKLVGNAKGHDDNIWSDDEVEVFIDPGKSHRNYYHFSTNVRGIKREEFRDDPAWTCNWTVAVGKTENQWIAEIFIPFAALKLNPNTKPIWGINFCRNDQLSRQASQWKNTNGSFHNPKLFASFGPLSINLKKYSNSIKMELPEVCWPGKNAALVKFVDQSRTIGGISVELNVYDRFYKLLSSHVAKKAINRNCSAELDIEYVIPAIGDFFLELVVRDAKLKNIISLSKFYSVHAVDKPMLLVDWPGDGIVFVAGRNKPLKLRVLIPPSLLTSKSDTCYINFKAVQDSGRVWASLPMQAVSQREVFIEWPIKNWVAGHYSIEANVKAGQIEKTVSTKLYIVPKGTENYVRIDEFGRTVIKQPGKSERLYFPIGLFSAHVFDSKVLRKLSENGINALQDYSFVYLSEKKRQAYLDNAFDNNIMVLATLKDYVKEIPISQQMTPKAIELATMQVTNYRNHPAILSWYVADEPESNSYCKPHKLVEFYRLLKGLDPLHPLSAAFCQSHGVGNYFYGYDIAMPDIYPYPEHVKNSYSIMNRYFGSVCKHLKDRKPFWAVLQAYDKVRYDKAMSKEYSRTFPTYKEIRLMTFQALAHGARGLWYYEWNKIDKPEYKAMLDGLFRVTKEVSKLSPVLLTQTRECAQIFNSGQVRGIWLKYKKAWYLLLANGELKERHITVSFPQDIAGKSYYDIMKVVEGEKLYSCPKAKLDNKCVRLKLDSMEALVLKINTSEQAKP